MYPRLQNSGNTALNSRSAAGHKLAAILIGEREFLGEGIDGFAELMFPGIAGETK